MVSSAMVILIVHISILMMNLIAMVAHHLGLVISRAIATNKNQSVMEGAGFAIMNHVSVVLCV